MREKTNLCRKIPNDLCRYFPIKEVEHNCPVLKCSLCIVTSFQRVPFGKGGPGGLGCGEKVPVERVPLHWRNLSNYLSQKVKVNINCDESFWQYDMMGRTLYFCGLLPQTHTLGLIVRQTSDKSQLRDRPQNTWPVLLKTVTVIKNKKKLKIKKKTNPEEHSQSRGA